MNITQFWLNLWPRCEDNRQITTILLAMTCFSHLKRFAAPLTFFCMLFVMNYPYALGKDQQKFRDTLGVFNIEDNPSKQDWGYFRQQTFDWKKDLWYQHTSQGHALASWHWGWRIAWVKACGQKQYFKSRLCREIIQASETDQALVVRSQTVEVYHALFHNSQNKHVINKLAKMYTNPRNFRRGQPLYISQEIISAIKGIGGNHSTLVIDKLVQMNQQNTQLSKRNKPQKKY
ncbi:MAG: hypothetical protein OXC40_01865 [Proteobacteria bacterium]|nr:hypothetical protein [Pseudomonadota bacterium]